MTGVAGPWGVSPQQVAKMDEYSDLFTNRLSITSIVPTFDKYGNYNSPLTMANKSFYNRFGSRFGNDVCTKFKDNECENPNTGRPIKKYGRIYNGLVEQCKAMFEGPRKTVSTEKRAERPTRIIDSIFIGKKPPLPEIKVSNSNNHDVRHFYNGEPKYVSIDNNKYSIGSSAKIFPDGRTGKVIKIGPNNIILAKSDNRERRLTLDQFVKLNAVTPPRKAFMPRDKAFIPKAKKIAPRQRNYDE